jgi:hypothetical protein
MLGNILSLEFGGFYGGEIGNFLSYFEQIGGFSYLLPFLLIFAVVFGVLMKTKIFKDNRGLNAIIAFVVALLALQFEFVPLFFSEIFPRVGVGLSVILVFLILVGLFLDPEHKYLNYILLILAVIVFFVVLIKTAGYLGWYSGWFWQTYWPSIVVGIVVIAIIAAVINSVSGKERDLPTLKPVWSRN